jgi:hypothetical protein
VAGLTALLAGLRALMVMALVSRRGSSSSTIVFGVVAGLKALVMALVLRRALLQRLCGSFVALAARAAQRAQP